MDHIDSPSELATSSPHFKPHAAPPPSPPPPPPEHAAAAARSPDTFLEVLSGSSGADPAGIVEELTVQNYRAPSSSAAPPQPTWRNFTRIGAAPARDALTEDLSLPMDAGVLCTPPRIPDGIRTRVVQGSGFPQFMMRSSLKGKGVAYRHPEVEPAENEAVSPRAAPPPREQGIAGREERGSFYGGAATGTDSNCLRQWLRQRTGKFDKAERLHVLRQVVELVDMLHSQGLALRSLRPTQFQMLAVDQVKYVGALVHEGQFAQVPVNEDIQHFKRKRGFGHEAIGQTKLLKYSEGNRFGGGLNVGFRGDGVRELDGGVFKTWNGESDKRKQSQMVQSREFGSKFKSPVASYLGGQLASDEMIMLEERWYASPEEINEGVCSLSSNIYNLGVLVFELFCYFESWEVHSTAMLDLRHRILPPNFLSESPKEASFCLWLLHPEPSSRPKSKDILMCDLVCEGRDLSSVDHSSASIDEQDAEADLLMHFLLTLKEQKEKRAAKLIADLGFLQADAEEVERRQSSRARFLSTANNLENDTCFKRETMQSEPTHLLPMPTTNDDRLQRNMDQLEDAYFSMRSKVEHDETSGVARRDIDVLVMRDRRLQQLKNDTDSSKKATDCLGSFYEGLSKYARYNRFEVCGSLKNVDILNSANVICSMSFDRDEEYFATAGVSKKLKIFEYNSLLDESVDIHYPLIEMSSRSKISCVCWNSYIKNYLASTDYDGVVQLWDASTGQGFTQFREHQKRAWSVDFSQTDPMKLASGSDDCSVKIWNINEKNSTNTIRNMANVCCVQFSSYSSHFLACGSADYKIYCYDLRNTRTPWCVLSGHEKTVSYVKFIDSETIVSASTDNTLKLWDLKKTKTSAFSTEACSLTLRGHTNEKNFVGLSVSNGYIACGSETNEVYAYCKTFPMPVTSHKFGSTDQITGDETSHDNGQFVSSVCWRTKSNVVVAANSSGSIKLLRLV